MPTRDSALALWQLLGDRVRGHPAVRRAGARQRRHHPAHRGRHRADRDPRRPARRPAAPGGARRAAAAGAVHRARRGRSADPIAWPAFIIAALGYIGLLRRRRPRADRPAGAGRCWCAAPPAASAPARLAPPTTGARCGCPASASGSPRSRWRSCCPRCCRRWSPTRCSGSAWAAAPAGAATRSASPTRSSSMRGQLTPPRTPPSSTYTSSDGSPALPAAVVARHRSTASSGACRSPRGAPEDRVSERPAAPPPGLGPAVRTDAGGAADHGSATRSAAALPAAAVPADRRCDVEGDWRADRTTLMVFSTRDEARGLGLPGGERRAPAHRRACWTRAGPPPADVVERYLRLPRDLPPRDRASWPREVTQDAATPYAKAVRLQEWFTEDGDFTYSLHDPGAEQLRAGRLPDPQPHRVLRAVRRRDGGDGPGARHPLAGRDRLHRRHPGRPTAGRSARTTRTPGRSCTSRASAGCASSPRPSGPFGQGTARAPDYSEQATPTGERRAEQHAGRRGDPDAGGERAADEAGADRGATRASSTARLGGVPVEVDEGMPLAAKIGIGAGVLLLIALIPAAWRVLTRLRRRRGWTRRRRRPAARPPARPGGRAAAGRAPRRAAAVRRCTAAWAELCDVLYDYGMTRRASESPRALARRLTEQYEFDPEAAAAMHRIASPTERLLLARDPGRETPRRDDIRRVRRALAATVSRRRRMRAVLLRPRRCGGCAASASGVLDGFDRLENIRLRRRAPDIGDGRPRRPGPRPGRAATGYAGRPCAGRVFRATRTRRAVRRPCARPAVRACDVRKEPVRRPRGFAPVRTRSADVTCEDAGASPPERRYRTALPAAVPWPDAGRRSGRVHPCPCRRREPVSRPPSRDAAGPGVPARARRSRPPRVRARTRSGAQRSS